jgi:hypothetical protein
MTKDNFLSINANSLPWNENFDERIGRTILRKELFRDAETGMLVRLSRYPAGVVNPGTRIHVRTACMFSKDSW